MSDSLILAIGALMFLATATATLMFGYYRMGALYDRSEAAEIRRRLDNPTDRAATDVAHDRPEEILAAYDEERRQTA